MKTLQLLILVVIFLMILGNANSYALNFESVKSKYYPLVHVTTLNAVITNSSTFKEKIHGYHYNLITTISKVRYLQNNSYELGPTDVIYYLHVSNFPNPDKALVVTIDQNQQILGMTECSPWSLPLGYPLPLIDTSLYVPENYTASKIDLDKLVIIMPPSPLEQVKHGVAVNDVDCFQGLQPQELIFKSEDKSPACVNPGSTRYLIERGWAINQTNQEWFNLVDEHVGEITKNKNGTVGAMELISMHIQNFQVFSPPVTVKIFYTNGTLYKTDEISSNDILPNGYYKYNLTISSTDVTNVFGDHRVYVEHNDNIGEILVGIPPPP